MPRKQRSNPPAKRRNKPWTAADDQKQITRIQKRLDEMYASPEHRMKALLEVSDLPAWFVRLPLTERERIAGEMEALAAKKRTGQLNPFPLVLVGPEHARKSPDTKKAGGKKGRPVTGVMVNGKGLKAARLATGMTQEELAATLGIGRRNLQRAERGTGRLPADVAEAAARELSIPGNEPFPADHFIQKRRK
jgi:DNA-binding XRE family transcriptional regulator